MVVNVKGAYDCARAWVRVASSTVEGLGTRLCVNPVPSILHFSAFIILGNYMNGVGKGRQTKKLTDYRRNLVPSGIYTGFFQGGE